MRGVNAGKQCSGASSVLTEAQGILLAGFVENVVVAGLVEGVVVAGFVEGVVVAGLVEGVVVAGFVEGVVVAAQMVDTGDDCALVFEPTLALPSASTSLVRG